MRRARIQLGAAALAAILAFPVVGAATASGADSARATEPRKPAAASTIPTKKVRIIDYAFSPKAITISKGTQVKWVNTGTLRHTSTSNTGKWSSGPLAPGASFNRVFKRAGTFRYHCSIHPYMTGKVVVQ